MPTDITSPTAFPAPDRLPAERLFFTGLAASMLAAVVVGFAPTYYLLPLQPGPPRPAPFTFLVHLHGVLFSAWMLLFMVQTALVAKGRRGLHVRLGLLGLALVLAMIPVGTLAALHQVHRLTGPPGIDPLSWLAFPLFSVAGLAGLFLSGLWLRKRPAAHKRLMVLGMATMMSAAFGRIAAIPTFVAILVAPLLYLAALLVWDVATRRRPHAATIVGGGVAVLATVGPLFVWRTPEWKAFAAWAAGLVI